MKVSSVMSKIYRRFIWDLGFVSLLERQKQHTAQTKKWRLRQLRNKELLEDFAKRKSNRCFQFNKKVCSFTSRDYWRLIWDLSFVSLSKDRNSTRRSYDENSLMWTLRSLIQHCRLNLRVTSPRLYQSSSIFSYQIMSELTYKWYL